MTIGQIMAECDCAHEACLARGHCMANRIEELGAALATARGDAPKEAADVDTSKEARRFEPFVTRDTKAAGMWEVNDGKWVRASEYDALAAKLTEVTAERDDCMTELEIAIDQRDDAAAVAHRAEAALATARRDALREVMRWAENERRSCNAAGDRSGAMAYRRLYLKIRALPDTEEGEAPINWRDDPDAIVEDDEPQIGRDYS